MKFYRQFDQMDCGAACVRMVASHYGLKLPLSYLRSLCGLTREGVSVAGIRQALDCIGFDSLSFAMTPAQLAKDCPLPAILFWEQRHFVVLERITSKGNFAICDPAFGRHKLTPCEFESKWLNGYSGVVIAAEPGKNFCNLKPDLPKHGFMQCVRKYLVPYRVQMIQSIVVLGAAMVIGMIVPLLTKAMVDEGIMSKDISLILTLLIAQLTLFGTQLAMSLAGAWVSLYLTTRVSVSILNDYLEKLIKLPFSFFETKTAGDHQQRINDHSRLQNFLTSTTVETAFSLLSVPVYITIIFIYSPLVSCIYLLLTAVAIGWTLYFFDKRKALDYEQFALNSQNQSETLETLAGIADVKLNASGHYRLSRWRKLQERIYGYNRKSLRISQIQSTGYSAISQLRNLMITAAMALGVVNGTLSVGMMIAISAMTGLIAAPLAQLVSFIQLYQDAKISLERSEEVHLGETEDNSTQSSLEQETPLDIVFKNVSYKYSAMDSNPALQGLCLSIPAGKLTAVVGQSGSGKSTLIKLIQKFHNPSEGHIYFGKHDISELSAESIRHHSGMVMQENYLFSDTLEQNITMGNPIDPERLKMAVEAASLDNFINSHPLGLQMKIGAQGRGISGGEKQRIMIARAIYKNPLYLILDEATSHLDAEHEARITQNIARCCSSATRIVVAHRLSTVREAHNIIVLHKGKIVEQGAHDQLIDARGYYYNLIKNQLELAT